MINFSKRTVYGLKALLVLAESQKRDAANIMQLGEIARRECIPPKFLEHIMSSLQKKGLVRSRKGKGGGYYLAKAPGEIFVIQVAELFDGGLRTEDTVEKVQCAIREGQKDSGILSVVLEAQEALSQILGRVSLDELQRRAVNFKQWKDRYVGYSI